MTCTASSASSVNLGELFPFLLKFFFLSWNRFFSQSFSCSKCVLRIAVFLSRIRVRRLKQPHPRRLALVTAGGQWRLGRQSRRRLRPRCQSKCAWARRWGDGASLQEHEKIRTRGAIENWQSICAGGAERGEAGTEPPRKPALPRAEEMSNLGDDIEAACSYLLP